MKKILVISGLAALTLVIANCSSSAGGSGSERLTTAGKMNAGIGGAVDTISGIGGSLGAGSVLLYCH